MWADRDLMRRSQTPALVKPAARSTSNTPLGLSGYSAGETLKRASIRAALSRTS